jgi:hypothetical protein
MTQWTGGSQGDHRGVSVGRVCIIRNPGLLLRNNVEKCGGLVSYMAAWPRGTGFSQLPSAVTSTVDHPLGSPSLWWQNVVDMGSRWEEFDSSRKALSSSDCSVGVGDYFRTHT